MEAQENNQLSGGQAERNLRRIDALPAQALSALIVFCCEQRAAGDSLDSISSQVAEKFQTRITKPALSRYFRGKWLQEYEKQCGLLDSQVNQHWIARRERRIAFYQRLALKAELAGEFAVAGRMAELAAREMDAMQAGGRSTDSLHAEGLLKLAEAIKGMNTNEYERLLESLPAAADRTGALAVN